MQKSRLFQIHTANVWTAKIKGFTSKALKNCIKYKTFVSHELMTSSKKSSQSSIQVREIKVEHVI